MAKRHSGYRVRVDMFLPVDPASLDDTIGKAEVIRKALAGDLAGLVGGGRVLGVAQSFTSMSDARLGPHPAEPAPYPGDAVEPSETGPNTTPDGEAVLNPEPVDDGAPIPRTPEHGSRRRRSGE